MGSLNRDYAVVEEELEETKKTVMELMSRKDQTRELQREREEKEALRAELEKVKKGRVSTSGGGEA